MKIVAKLRRLKKGNRLLIENEEYFVVKKERTTIREHKPLNEILIGLTGNRMISTYKNSYEIYKIIQFGPIRILWRIWKKPKIRF